MSSFRTPNYASFKIAAACAKGKAVKFSSGLRDTMEVGSANTDRCAGVLQAATTVAGEVQEVAMPGGGGQGLLGEAVVAGNDLVCGSDGRLVKPNAAGDEIIARAEEDGAENDLIAISVYNGSAHAAQA